MRFRSSPPRKARQEVRSSSDKESGGAVIGAGLDEGCAPEVAVEGVAVGAEDAVAGAVPPGGSAAISYARPTESSRTPFN